MILGWATAALAATPALLTTLDAIHAMSNEQAEQALPVAFEATVTYFRSYEGTMFVQDGDVAIYVQAATNLKLVPGDRVLVKGTTRDSFHPIVVSNDITILHHGAVPKPMPATYDELIRAQYDCVLVSVRAKVRATDTAMSSDVANITLQLVTDGGTFEAIVDSGDPSPAQGLLDAEVEITGAASGRFDGKMQQTGILVHVSSWAGVKVLKRAAADPATLPITPMDQVLSGYHVKVLSQRIRVHGTITYSHPGSAIVLQNGPKSLWIETHSIAPVQLGDLADVTGFPGLHDGFLTLTNGEIKDSRVQAPIKPQPANWRQLSSSRNVFDLVSIEGQVVTEVREAAQDEYVLVSDGQVFSAIYRHPGPVRLVSDPLPPMKQIPLGSRIRVTGICLLDDSNPFNAQVPFTILLRSDDDIAVVAKPSWLNIENLKRLVRLLVLIIVAAAVWGVALHSKVHRQTADLSARRAAEGTLERRMAQLEMRRSRVLEDINGSRPLAELLEEITEMVSFRLEGARCWCEITDGARLGNYPPAPETLRLVREPIPARAGSPLGVLYAGFELGTQPAVTESEALIVGARLATLAIETRRLYSDLLHRSEFDQLTDIHNRFSLEKQITVLIEGARHTASIFGLIFIDLDQFKQVNDLYGHRIGDLYLQGVAKRMKHQLRAHDMLARLGGDEFAVLLPSVRSRAAAEEIAARLERCFDDPFTVEGNILHGAASVGIALYPENGATTDSLLSASDTAMYQAKNARKEIAQMLADEQKSNLKRKNSA